MRTSTRITAGPSTSAMPLLYVCPMRRAKGLRLEKPVIEFDVQMMGLYHPHQVHRVHRTREPAIRLVDVIADRFRARQPFIAELAEACVVAASDMR